MKITYDGESCQIDLSNLSVPLREVRKQLRLDIGMTIRSCRELDCSLRDPNAVYEIACRIKALKLLPVPCKRSGKSQKG